LIAKDSRRRGRLALLLSCAALPLGCSRGASSRSLPQAEVQLSANHHLYTLSTLREFTDFPVPANNTVACSGTFLLRSDSTYAAELAFCQGGQDDYALEHIGRLSVLVTPSARSGRVRYLGAYGLEGDTGVFFFTDRFTSETNNGIALFWGTRILPDVANLEGSWHVFAQSVIHTTSLTATPDNVGRTFAGTAEVAAAGAITGTALESTQANLALTGTVASFADSRLEVTLTQTPPQGAAEQRMFHASAGTPAGASAPQIVLGIDTTTSDGEAGLLAMMRKRTGTADATQLAGLYHVGLHTIFADASIPGSDVAFGELEFNSAGQWSFEGQGGGGVDFDYGGGYLLLDDGTLRLMVNGTGEEWRAAVDQTYRFLVIADHFVESRPAGKPPELNLMLGLRQSPPPMP
jgi:hypothetical protein